MSASMRRAGETGFTLLPVILAMSLIAAIAFLLNRDNGVNARMIANRSDLDRARYAAEAGLQAANFVVQGAGCTGNYPTSSAPVTNNNFGGATYSAYSSTGSLPGGNPPPPISLFSTGSYNGASVTLTRNNVYVYKPGTTTTLQPGPTSGYDTYLDNGSSSRNFGGDTVLRLSNLDSPNATYQPLLKFDLSIFPAGSRVIPWYDSGTGKLQPGATLSLYTSSSGYLSTAVVNAQLITRSWLAGTGTGGSSPNGATWTTYDGVNPWPSPGVGYAPAPVASTPYPNAIGWVNWDLTDAAAAWLSGVYPNYGIWLVGSGAAVGNTAYVSSNEASQTTRRPKLTLNTLLPCGTSVGGGGPSQTVTLAAAADTYITAETNNALYVKNYGVDLNMYVGQVGTSPNLEQRMLLKFDGSSVPPGSIIITSATLRLYATQVTGYSGAPKSLDAYALTEWFAEGTSQSSGNIYGATWVSRDFGYSWATWSPTVPGSGGGTYATTKYATGREESSGLSPLPGSFSSGWVTWDLTALTQAWVDGVIVNNGILVKSNPTDETYSVKFATDENNSSGGSHRPQLVVVYR